MTLIPVIGGIPVPDPLALIQASGKAESTRRLYARVLAPYLENGGNLAHEDRLRVYAETLPASRRRRLRAAVSLWAKETAKQLKATDMPEQHTLTLSAHSLTRGQTGTVAQRALANFVTRVYNDNARYLLHVHALPSPADRQLSTEQVGDS